MKTKRQAKNRRSAKRVESSVRWEEQRERLLQAAQRAIHRAGPQISMDEIAAEAGITKPILYRHFGDRRGLAVALRDSAFGMVLGVGKGGPASARQAARNRVAALYPVVDDPQDLRRVVVGFATGFQMFVELNRNIYRFLRAEGVLDRIWQDVATSNPDPEPVADSLATSLRGIYRARGIDETTANVWGHALRGMVTGIVDWSTEGGACDRFELERHFDTLAGSMIEGLDRALAKATKRKAPNVGARPRAKTPQPRKKRRPARPRRS